MRLTMPAAGNALEIASGTGEHCVRFAAEFPNVTWQPTDVAPQRLESICAWVAATGVENVRPPQVLHAQQPVWPFEPASFAAAVTVNLLHLIGQDVTQALFTGVRRELQPGGQWFLYGPFTREGDFVSDGDRAFHQQLIRQDPAIGYKDTSAIAALAQHLGFDLAACHHMPANNLMYVLRAPG
jgi:cyclopropane fatty-acyl-phospholipid synthase-like methyltransferase